MAYERETVRELFDGIAPRYDLLNRVLSAGVDRSWRRRLVGERSGSAHLRVLDVATGTADVLIELRRLRPQLLVGADLSRNMLERGRAKVLRASGEGPSLVQAAAERLPFRDGSFDLVTVAFGVRNFSDLGAGLRELHRVLTRNGEVRILEFSRPRTRLWGTIFGWYFNSVLPVVGGLVSGRPPAYRYLPQTVAAFPDGSAFAEALTAAGFRSPTWELLSGGIATLYRATIDGRTHSDNA